MYNSQTLYLVLNRRLYWRFCRNIVAQPDQAVLQCCYRISNTISRIIQSPTISQVQYFTVIIFNRIRYELECSLGRWNRVWDIGAIPTRKVFIFYLSKIILNIELEREAKSSQALVKIYEEHFGFVEENLRQGRTFKFFRSSLPRVRP